MCCLQAADGWGRLGSQLYQNHWDAQEHSGWSDDEEQEPDMLHPHEGTAPCTTNQPCHCQALKQASFTDPVKLIRAYNSGRTGCHDACNDRHLQHIVAIVPCSVQAVRSKALGRDSLV